jgi:hypothetical protein
MEKKSSERQEFAEFSVEKVPLSNDSFERRSEIVIYEPSAFFKARATKERVPLINARMNGRCLHASGSYNILCTKTK